MGAAQILFCSSEVLQLCRFPDAHSKLLMKTETGAIVVPGTGVGTHWWTGLPQYPGIV